MTTFESMCEILSEFWAEYRDEEGLIASQWANPTLSGIKAIEYAYDILCDMREVDPSQDFKTIEDFFRAQEVEA